MKWFKRQKNPGRSSKRLRSPAGNPNCAVMIVLNCQLLNRFRAAVELRQIIQRGLHEPVGHVETGDRVLVPQIVVIPRDADEAAVANQAALVARTR